MRHRNHLRLHASYPCPFQAFVPFCFRPSFELLQQHYPDPECPESLGVAAVGQNSKGHLVAGVQLRNQSGE